MLLFPLLLAARAAPVAAPPDGATSITVLACASDACSDELFWLQYDPAFADEPVIVVEALLADELAHALGADAAMAVDEALERARLAVLDGRWAEAHAALDDAERTMTQRRAAPGNQQLFTLWFLRGAATAVEGRSSGAPSFRRAAALAWNRTIALPAGTEPWAEAYYEALARHLEEGTGTLRIEPGATETSWWLDGVELGPAPIRVEVFGGTHWLEAHGQGHAARWQAEVQVRPGELTTARARFPGGDDEFWAAAALEVAIDRAWLEPELADLLQRFADRHGLRALRLLRLDPERADSLDEVEQEAGGGLPTFEARQTWYDPRLRRFSSRRD